MLRFGKAFTKFTSRFHRNINHITPLKSISNRSKILGCGGVLLGVSSAGYLYIIEAQTLDTEQIPFQLAHPDIHRALGELLGPDRYCTDPLELDQHGKEMSGYAKRGNPQAVVYPLTTEEVQEVVKLCASRKIPIVPYGAGTSLEGHTIAQKGGVTINCTMMNNVISVNEKDMDCVVQPGVGWVELNTYLEQYKLFLGVDPAPGACIGGMCATCCSGTNAVRYGTMKNQVLNLTVVMADGSVLKTGQRARKSSAGYDLARVFVGSEGTLGIVTEATLKLHNVPEHTAVARVSFASVKDAADAVVEILQEGIQMGAIELLDDEMIKACNLYSGTDLPESTCILFKFTGHKPHVDVDIQRVKQIITKHTKHEYMWASSEEEIHSIWGMRKHAFWASQLYAEQNYGEGKQLMATDVAVPISRLAEAIDDTKAEIKESFLFAPIVGHVGDGNYHVCIAFDPENPVEAKEAKRLNSNMVKRAIAMEGTCTGEHGVGSGKIKYLKSELGEGSVKLMKTIKRALDPNLILNPGKIVDMSDEDE